MKLSARFYANCDCCSGKKIKKITDSKKDKANGSFLLNTDINFLKTQYQVLSDRRIQHNGLFWNKPSILFTAQAFLWVVALNVNVNALMRLLVSFVSLLIAITMFYSYVRCRKMEICDAEQLLWIEKYFIELGIPAIYIHHKKDKRTVIYEGKQRKLISMEDINPALRCENPKAPSTYSFLKWTFISIIIVSFAIVLYNTFDLCKVCF